jgi:hypothetical protein
MSFVLTFCNCGFGDRYRDLSVADIDCDRLRSYRLAMGRVWLVRDLLVREVAGCGL